MEENKKNIIISIGFVMILIIVFIANIIKKDEKISISERRKLEQFPEITTKEVFNGNVSKKFEKYATDQFVKRDDLRKIKTFFNFGIYRQKDNNRLIVKDDMIYKIEYPLNKEAIQKTSKKLGEIKNEYLKEMKVYYSIIPDKSYFLEDDYLKMDYCEMKKIIDNNLKNSKYINICEELAKEDYYKTDIHWKQENLKKIVNKIENEMNLKDTSKIKYEEKEIGEFYGSLYGHINSELLSDYIEFKGQDVLFLYSGVVLNQNILK